MTRPLKPGDVRLAHVPSKWNAADHAHKRRPVVLVYREPDGQWKVATLTKLTEFRDGTPRTPIPGWRAACLDAQPYLWSERLVRVPAGNIDSLAYGRAPKEMVNALAELLGIQPEHADAMTGPKR